MELVSLFYLVDEFCKEFEPSWHAQLLTSGAAQRIKPSALSLSEIHLSTLPNEWLVSRNAWPSSQRMMGPKWRLTSKEHLFVRCFLTSTYPLFTTRIRQFTKYFQPMRLPHMVLMAIR